jgi:hypothetical protein
MYEDEHFDDEADWEAFVCLDCGVNTSLNEEYYMLTNEVWKEAVPDLVGMLCINCVELRLGRQLWPEDFMDSPINYFHSRLSARILSRFCGIPDDEADELLVILQNNKKEATQIIDQLRIQNMKGPNKHKP